MRDDLPTKEDDREHTQLSNIPMIAINDIVSSKTANKNVKQIVFNV